MNSGGVPPLVESGRRENVRIVAWDEWVGMVDRNAGSQSEHIDVMQCLLPDMEVPELHVWNRSRVGRVGRTWGQCWNWNETLYRIRLSISLF
ncbi:hypothetical protein V6N12_058478 [Hibiscus sabdariffa]|uniref:Uncharacterized protein n=1 Tax=Hibiscus sabdariffa TaxID=183260 RepID=A0ABR2ESA8_9ROSI